MPIENSDTQNNPEIGKPASPRGFSPQNPWVVFLFPFVVFMIVTSLEPTPDKPGGADLGLAIAYEYYPWVYAAKIALTAAAVLFVLPGYRRFPFKIGWLSILVGVIGVVLWVGICKLNIEANVLGPLGLEKLVDLGRRSGFNPLEQIQNPAAAWAFLLVRFFGLALIVPVIEEFFLRGFLMRFFVDRDWWDVPFGKVNAAAVAAGTIAPMLMHPAELVAAAVWFSLITWLMVRTRNIWDCVAAHAMTNFFLGFYVVCSGDWYFQ